LVETSNQLHGHDGEKEQKRPTAQKRLIALLDYIEQVEKLGRKPTYVVPTDFYCSYEDELRGLPGIEFDLAVEGDEVWLQVQRLKEQDPPPLPEKLKPWVILSKSPDKQPSLRDEITSPANKSSDPPNILKRTAFPDIDKIFEQYISGSWTAWTQYERPRRKTMEVYNRLFSIQQTMETEGIDTPLELVWGVGIALWKHDRGQNIVHPIITQLVEITLDSKSLALEVRPRDILPMLEADPFVALDVPGVLQLESTWRAYIERSEQTLSPFDPKSFEHILVAAVGYLDPSGRFWPEARKDIEDRRLPDKSEHLTITDTWVLYARKRSSNFLIEDLHHLKKDLESVKVVPGGPAALVSELSNEVEAPRPIFFRGLSFSGSELPPGTKPLELNFPKPYNEEQVSIVQKLETYDGVVVQGPPGTGKTHTIANVICHYLSNGKRVLVTSMGEPALAVLREQIPETVRALTVALLTDEKDGMRQFEHAIQTIAATISRFNSTEVERDIRALSNHINELHSRLIIIDQDISKWAKLHLKRISFHGREMLPEEIAYYVVENEKNFGWFPDKLSIKSGGQKFSGGDITSVRKARLSLGKDLAYLGADLPVADSFPDGNAILRLHDDLLIARQLASKMQQDGLPPIANAQSETLEKAQTLFGLVQEMLKLIDKIESAGHTYTATILQCYHSANVQKITNVDELLQAVINLEKERQRFVRRPVGIPQDAELDADFVEAVNRASNKKNPTGLLSIGKSKLKSMLGAVRVIGLKPQSEWDWDHVRQWIHFEKQCRALIARWNSTAKDCKLPVVERPTSESLQLLVANVEHITLIKRLAIDFDRRLPVLVSQVFGERLPISALAQDREHLSNLADILSKHLTKSRLAYASNAISDLGAKISGKTGAIIDDMRLFLIKDLGAEGVTAVEAGNKWNSFLAELRRLAANRGYVAEVARVSQLVEQAGAPNWAKVLRNDLALDGIDRWTPANWIEAWQWRQAVTYLQTIDGREALARLQASRRETEIDLAHAYQELVEKKTWLEVYKNSPDSIKAALQAYLNAVMHIGRGTGIRAVRYRKEARNAMLNAYRAVPCWIMPQWRVSETLPPEIGKFDLVIVDEASQSDIWSLPCLLRGQKLLIVGDDKQVSPAGIGLAEEKIKDLKNRFLREQVHGNEMTPEKSLYDLAKVVFAGKLVMLREHFRCVAPIIEFSKREFYNHEIRPLRIPKSSERLDPPLVDVYVRGASRDGKINEIEARAIIDEIKTILTDKHSVKRTIGVVSLLGIEQAHRIFELIKEEIPAEEIVERKMTVGDARTFQGKERDIMLMSMVATPDQMMTASGTTYDQRFNVAASRARDRMYLFRSVELSDLNKIDLKAKLIEHFAAPFREDPIRVASMRDLCQSGFERAMFDILVEKGYRVQPQVNVGGYKIDLVVEGEEDRRLAIECDGDQYHGPERWSADMARQRILERAGWTFWRCFSSSFTLSREAILKDLFAALNKMGIEPIGNSKLDIGRYTEHRIVDPLSVTHIV
jgi:very-short-patch-repair endonuclease